jgi:hypothetical protein
MWASEGDTVVLLLACAEGGYLGHGGQPAREHAKERFEGGGFCCAKAAVMQFKEWILLPAFLASVAFHSLALDLQRLGKFKEGFCESIQDIQGYTGSPMQGS